MSLFPECAHPTGLEESVCPLEGRGHSSHLFQCHLGETPPQDWRLLKFHNGMVGILEGTAKGLELQIPESPGKVPEGIFDRRT